MLRRIHELKRHEEGQALVLAAISMLVLTLCVMATVNLSYAVHQKMQLQDAADSVAYTTAAYEARALNFFAYTNRAMVVQYCAQMNVMALLTYAVFELGLVSLLMDILMLIPGVDAVAAAIQRVVQVIVTILTVAVAIFVPAIDIINYFTGLTQFAVSTDMALKIASGPTDELSRINSEGHHQYDMSDPVSTGLRILSGLSWERTVLTSPLPGLSAPTGEEDSFNRAMMTEIANGSRHPWTAFGGKASSFNPIARHFRVNLFILQFRRTARTEWGAFKPRTSSGIGGTLGDIIDFLTNLTSITEQIYSREEFDFSMKLPWGTVFDLQYQVWARADREMWRRPSMDASMTVSFCHFGRWNPLRYVCEAALAPIRGAITAGVAAANMTTQSMIQTAKNIPIIHFGMAPYARFRLGPSSASWNRPSAGDLFHQPPVITLLTEPSADIVAGGQPFMRKFAQPMSSLSSSNSPLMRESGNTFSAPSGGWRSNVDFKPDGTTMGFTKAGFHALAAAEAYYHRPGDWREPPNLFNPFWGAKLMPIVDYPTLSRVPMLSSLLNQKLLVH